jgi:hypothetical protein
MGILVSVDWLKNHLPGEGLTGATPAGGLGSYGNWWNVIPVSELRLKPLFMERCGQVTQPRAG